MNRLAKLYILNNKYAKAESTCMNAIEVLEKSLGNNNDHTAMARNTLAKLYIHRGEYTKAKKLCNTSLSTLENIFDENHPNIADVLETMAQLYQQTGDIARSHELDKRVQVIRSSSQVAMVSAATSITQ
jgi:lipopolysaccharide biosynthesis regulator YciM